MKTKCNMCEDLFAKEESEVIKANGKNILCCPDCWIAIGEWLGDQGKKFCKEYTPQN